MRTFFLICSVLLCLAASSQRVRDFNVYDGGNGSVAVRFSLTPGPTCSGYEIMHSTDSIVFNSVEYSDQACGGSGTVESFEWTHTSPALNQNNYYRINILSPYEVSHIRSVYVSEPGRSRMLTWPNPVLANNEVMTVKAYNSGNVKLIGYLHNRFGTTIGEVELFTTADTGTLDVSGLSNDLYILWLTDGTNVYSHKFIVQR